MEYSWALGSGCCTAVECMQREQRMLSWFYLNLSSICSNHFRRLSTISLAVRQPSFTFTKNRKLPHFTGLLAGEWRTRPSKGQWNRNLYTGAELRRTAPDVSFTRKSLRFVYQLVRLLLGARSTGGSNSRGKPLDLRVKGPEFDFHLGPGYFVGSFSW